MEIYECPKWEGGYKVSQLYAESTAINQATAMTPFLYYKYTKFLIAMFGEPQKRSTKYVKKAISKTDLAKAYGVSRKTMLSWIRKAKIKMRIHNGKFWQPWEANFIIEHLGEPDLTFL